MFPIFKGVYLLSAGYEPLSGPGEETGVVRIAGLSASVYDEETDKRAAQEYMRF